MLIRLDEGSLERRTKQGPKLYSMQALPEGKPSAFVGIVHGYADHSGRHAHVMEVLAERGIGAVSIDLRGHGRAEGKRGHVTNFMEYADDIDELAERVANLAGKEGAEDAPRVLYGHSMGGLATFHAALRTPATWKALAHTDPFFGLALEVPWAKRTAGKIAARLYPKLALPTGLSGSALTHDLEIAAKYDRDPLVFKTATAGWFDQATKAQERAMERAPELTMPYWALHGGADSVAKLETAHAIFTRVGSEKKEWYEAPSLYHEPFNEPGWRPLVERLATFVLAQH